MLTMEAIHEGGKHKHATTAIDDDQMPEIFSKLVPAFEGIFSTPISNTGPSMPGQWVHETTGVVGPSIYYIGQYFEVGLMAQIPVNAASGRHVGALAVIDFFLDDIAPDTLGKPLFGAPPSRAANF